MMTVPNDMTQDPVAKTKKKGHLIPVLILAGGILAFFVLGGGEYLSFETLRDNRQDILAWTADHYVLAVLGFVLAYHVAVMFSLPGAVWLSLTGGFLFGTMEATAYIVVGATAGAVGIFLLARHAFYDFFQAKVGRALVKMEKGFQEDALSYMLVLRLVPIFPFWLVNLVPALLGVKVSTYTLGTFVGIIPGAFVYASVGSGLGAVFDEGKTPDLGVIFSPEVIAPIIGLALLAMVPVLYKKVKQRGKT